MRYSFILLKNNKKYKTIEINEEHLIKSLFPDNPYCGLSVELLDSKEMTLKDDIIKKLRLKLLESLAKKEDSKWIKEAKFNIENKYWLDKSAKISIKILRAIRRNPELNKTKLAKLLKVSPKFLNEVLSGQKNLNLKTISKIEEVLKIKLI